MICLDCRRGNHNTCVTRDKSWCDCQHRADAVYLRSLDEIREDRPRLKPDPD